MEEDSLFHHAIQKFLQSGISLPEELKPLVVKFQSANNELSEASEEVKEKLFPVLLKMGAYIAAQLQNNFDEQSSGEQEIVNVDKQRQLILKAKALSMMKQKNK